MIPIKPRVPRNGVPKSGVTKGMMRVGTPSFTAHLGKGGSEEMLPSRHALATLTKGDPAQRTIGNYAKLTPIGAGAPGTYAEIQGLARGPGSASDGTPDGMGEL